MGSLMLQVIYKRLTRTKFSTQKPVKKTMFLNVFYYFLNIEINFQEIVKSYHSQR